MRQKLAFFPPKKEIFCRFELEEALRLSEYRQIIAVSWQLWLEDLVLAAETSWECRGETGQREIF